MATKVKAVLTAEEVAAKAAKREMNAKVKQYKEALEDGTIDQLAYDKDGNLLTNALFFNGMPRPPKGIAKKVKASTCKKVPVTHKYQNLTDIKKLRTEAKEWNVVVYKTATEHLYKLLADVYVLAKGLYAVEKDEKVLRKDLKEYAKQLNVTVKASTKVVGILVNCVFQDVPRQRRSAYSIGLQNLVNEVGYSKDAKAVVKLINDAGGIYELAKPYIDAVQKKTQSKEYVLNKVKSSSVCKTADKSLLQVLKRKDVQYVLVVTRSSAKGNVTINSMTDDEAVVLSVARKLQKLKPAANDPTMQDLLNVKFTANTLKVAA